MATEHPILSRTTVAFAAALLCAVGGSPVASAQDEDEGGAPADAGRIPSGPPQRLYVVATPTSDGLEAASARVGAAARASLRRHSGVQWAGPDQALLGYSDFVMQRLTRGRERLEGGRQAYLNLELDEAIELLGSAVDDFDSAAAALEDPHDLGEALLFLGASQTFAGQARAARQTFERLHVQMPHVEPDPNLFNPQVVQRYQQAAPRDRSAPSASLTIESEPPGAVAYVDFVPRGRTPVTIEGLVGGVHVVRVTRPGATPFVQQVDLRRGQREEINAYLEDNEATAGLADSIQALSTASFERMEPGSPIAEIALALELDKIGVIRVGPGDGEEQVRLQLLVFDVSDGQRIVHMHGPVPSATGELEAAVGRLVTAGLNVALQPRGQAVTTTGGGTGFEMGSGSQEVVDDGEPGIFGKWWFWTAVGGAVLLGVLIGIIASSSGGQELGQDRGGQIVLEF